MTTDYLGPKPGRELVEGGFEIAGSAAGAAAGLLFGPAGGVAGAALSPLLGRTLRWGTGELAARIQGKRGRIRVGAAAAFAAVRMAELQEAGGQVRDDGFLEEQPSGRNAGRELLEGVLLAARDSFEERKVRHIGYLFANVAFSDLDPALANQMIGLAERLTWRQYVLLALVNRREETPLPDGDLNENPGAWEPWGARTELLALYDDRRLLWAPDRRTRQDRFSYRSYLMGELRLARGGRLLHELLSLGKIDNEEVEAVRHLLTIKAANDSRQPEEEP